MQTPISFALEILLDCDTIEQAHKLCRKYIKELEKGMTHPRITMVPSGLEAAFQAQKPSSIVQAPSTQRLLEQHAQAQPTSAPIAAPIATRIVGGEVQTGNGTRGPRKF